ncbi:MAG TPA: ABC transporter substrate-binding protein, partial [Limnochordales bacterium]
YPVTGITIVRDALTHGYFDKFIFGDSLAAPALIEPFGNALDGSFGVAAVSDEWPGFKEIQRDYAERYGEPAQIAFFKGMYDAVFLLALAMEQAGETSGPAVREALRQVTGPSEAYVVPGDWAGAVRLIRDGTRIQYRGNPMHLGFDENGDPVLGTVGLWTVVDGRLTVFAGQALRAEMIPGTGEPVKVGVLLPLTGELAAFGAALKPVAEFAASHVNVQGGLLDGRRLEVVVADDGTDPETAVAAARRLVKEEGVSALVTISSDVALRVATEVSVPSRVLHVTLATSPVIAELDDDDYVFRAAVSDRQQAAALAMLADRLGHSRLAVMYVNNAYGQGLAQHFAQEFTQRGGQVTAQVAFEPGRVSYREEVAAAAAQGAQALVLIAYPESGAVIVDEALAGGHFRKFLFADALQAPEFVAAFGRALDGSWGTSVSSRPEGTAYLRQEFARFPGAAGFVPLFHEMYDAIFLIAMAMEKAGTTSGPAVRDAIRRLCHYGQREVFPGAWTKAAELIRAGEPVWYAGQPGRLGFDGHGDPAIARVGVWTVRDGQIQAVGEVEAP